MLTIFITKSLFNFLRSLTSQYTHIPTHRTSVVTWSLRSDQIRSIAQSCLALCDPMNRSTPGLPVHHQLPEFTQTLVQSDGTD